MKNIMVYGAGGYTGGLISDIASKIGLPLVIAGRSTSGLEVVEQSLGIKGRVFSLDVPSEIDAELGDSEVLINCAGPFLRTARPLIEACIRNGVHYLDIAAELDSYLICSDRDAEARQANVMLLPGAGGSVSMLGCLASHCARYVTDPTAVEIALSISGGFSRGSANSAAENMAGAPLQRINGGLVEIDVRDTCKFDFHQGLGPVNCFPVTLPDLITIPLTLAVANVRTYVHVVASTDIPELDRTPPAGPSQEEREKSPYHAAVVVTGKDGSVHRSILHSVNGYTFTALASVEAALRVLQGQSAPGFHTPANIFGEDFVLSIPGTQMVDL
jgi:short subunit dehydrogenase-like uncharacterized protein